MVQQTEDITEVLLEPGLQGSIDKSIFSSYNTENRPYDISSNWTYRGRKGSGRACGRCFSWFNFGLLCLLLGALGGYLLRVYLDQIYKESDFKNKGQTERELDYNVSPMTPKALKQQGIPDQIITDKLTSKMEDDYHVVHGISQSKEDVLLDKAVREILENMTGVQGLPDLHLKNKFNLTKDPSQRVYLSVGMRNDYTLQACGETKLKQSFPDVDYALFGYNVLKGYPLAVGHDPGFTLPIFSADYSTGSQSADCRYSVPRGLTIVPDVSCVASFTSEIITSEREFRQSLNVAAGVNGGGWGASFSVSGGYNQAKKDLSKNSKTYIISTAKCNYYFSKLIKTNAPPFNPNFMYWIKRLEESEDENTFIDFFEIFGTHFQTEVSFGARYSYEHIMTKSEFENKTKEGFNIAMAASYSGLFSIGGHFALDNEKKEMAKTFSEKIETKTVSVGAAPPADGDAMKWASSVQSNPVPVYYKLSSIENLFTTNYMDGLYINYTKIYDNIRKYKYNYTQFLIQRNSLQENCNENNEENIVINNTRLKFLDPPTNDPSKCTEKCYQDENCQAISKPTNSQGCWFNTNSHNLSGEYMPGWTTYLLRKNVKENIKLENTGIFGTGTVLKRHPVVSLDECTKSCFINPRCFALSYGETCKLFDKNKILNLNMEKGTASFIVSKCSLEYLA